jgi:hypothetical protein
MPIVGRRRWVWLSLWIGAAAVVHAAVALAGEIEGVRFADVHDTAGVRFKLQCVGLLRYKLIFKGYVAALYLAEGASGADPLADVPKRLELSYFWSIDGEDFGPAAETILARNFDSAALEPLRSRLRRIDDLYENVEPGDRYSLTYLPGIGTELALNGQRKGVIEGADFAAKYFAIWLGTNPLDASLKRQLTSCSAPS